MLGGLGCGGLADPREWTIPSDAPTDSDKRTRFLLVTELVSDCQQSTGLSGLSAPWPLTVQQSTTDCLTFHQWCIFYFKLIIFHSAQVDGSLAQPDSQTSACTSSSRPSLHHWSLIINCPLVDYWTVCTQIVNCRTVSSPRLSTASVQLSAIYQ